jgi:hypothetical protein
VKIRAILPVLLLTGIMQSSSVSADENLHSKFWNYLYSNYEFLPECHFDSELRNFYLYQSIYYKEHYFLENTTNIEFVMFSFKKTVLWVWDFTLINGMGQTPGNIVFDPIDIGYEITPMFEYRLPSVTFQLGLEHNCYHQIDRQDLPTVYYNNPVFAVGSKNMRLFDYWAALTEKKTWTFNDRFSWYCRSGYYLRGFFGLVAPSKLNGINPYVADLSGEMRYCFYGRRSWIFDVKSNSMIGYYTEIRGNPSEGVTGNPTGDGIGWKQYLTLEANFRRGAKGGMLFATYGFDGLPLYPEMTGSDRVPRFSYDRLLQLGLKFFM